MDVYKNHKTTYYVQCNEYLNKKRNLFNSFDLNIDTYCVC